MTSRQRPGAIFPPCYSHGAAQLPGGGLARSLWLAAGTAKCTRTPSVLCSTIIGSLSPHQAERFDGITWHALPSATLGRSCSTSAIVGDDLYVIGGWDGSDALAAVERFHLPSSTWHSAPSLQIPRKNASAVAWNGTIYVAGAAAPINTL